MDDELDRILAFKSKMDTLSKEDDFDFMKASYDTNYVGGMGRGLQQNKRYGVLVSLVVQHWK